MRSLPGVLLPFFALIAAAAPPACAQQANASAYSERDVAFDNPKAAGVRIAGTLTVPAGEGPFPAVVLLSGAGPHDRDGTNAGHKPFAALADHLSSRGVAVLRTDDRGVGASSGDLSTASWFDLASDAEAGVAFLRGQPKIDRDAVGVIGHSQGGIIAPIVATRESGVAFLISLAGPSIDFSALTLSQRRKAAMAQGAPEEAIARSESVLGAAFAAMTAAASIDDARQAVCSVLTAEALAKLGATEAAREALVGQIATEQMFVSLHNNPQRVLPRVRVPVLALTGTLDSVLDADENLAAIKAATPENPDVTTLKLEGLNHFFQTALTGSPDEYATLKEDFAPVALEAISSWIDARFGSGR